MRTRSAPPRPTRVRSAEPAAAEPADVPDRAERAAASGTPAVPGARGARSRAGCRRRRARSAAARDGTPDGAPDGTPNSSAAALGAMGRAYWAFARDHADLYQVMYGLGGTRFPAEETRAEGEAVGAAFGPVVAALSGPGAAPDEVERRVYTLWATVHGLVALVLAGRIVEAWSGGQALADAAVAEAATRWAGGDPAARPTSQQTL